MKFSAHLTITSSMRPQTDEDEYLPGDAEHEESQKWEGEEQRHKKKMPASVNFLIYEFELRCVQVIQV